MNAPRSRREAPLPRFDARPVEGPEADAELAAVCKALGHPTRVRLLRFLRQREGGATVGALVEALGVAQSTVSEHLRVLREVGLVQPGEDRRKTAYLADVHQLRRLKAVVGSL